MKKQVVLTIFALTIAFATGCTKEKEVTTSSTPKASESTQPTAMASSSASPSTSPSNQALTGTSTFKDMLEREVTVPLSPEKVVTDGILPFPAAYFVSGHDVSALKAMHPSSKSVAENSMIKILAPEMLNATTNIFSGKDINVEEILKINPDVVYALSDKPDVIKRYEDANINAVAIRAASAANGNALETINSWFQVLKNTGGDAAAMDSIIQEGKANEAMIAEKLKDVKEKPSAMILFTNDGEQVEVTGKNFFGEYWLKSTGATDPASVDVSGRKMVNMEQIYKWNPDIIYITNFTTTMPEDLYENKIPGQDWSTVNAVKNKKVYKIPIGVYRWFPPSGDSPLMLKWLAQKNHPDIFTYSIESEIKDYYKKHYNYELTDAEVLFILNPDKAAVAGYVPKK